MSDDGGVIFADEESSVNVAAGLFYDNEAANGGVAFVNEAAALLVQGGTFSLNVAENGGGVFLVDEGGHIKVSQRAEGRVSGSFSAARPERPLTTAAVGVKNM